MYSRGRGSAGQHMHTLAACNHPTPLPHSVPRSGSRAWPSTRDTPSCWWATPRAVCQRSSSAPTCAGRHSAAAAARVVLPPLLARQQQQRQCRQQQALLPQLQTASSSSSSSRGLGLLLAPRPAGWLSRSGRSSRPSSLWHGAARRRLTQHEPCACVQREAKIAALRSTSRVACMCGLMRAALPACLLGSRRARVRDGVLLRMRAVCSCYRQAGCCGKGSCCLRTASVRVCKCAELLTPMPTEPPHLAQQRNCQRTAQDQTVTVIAHWTN
jgi:hypothetical protein